MQQTLVLFLGEYWRAAPRIEYDLAFVHLIQNTEVILNLPKFCKN